LMRRSVSAESLTCGEGVVSAEVDHGSTKAVTGCFDMYPPAVGRRIMARRASGGQFGLDRRCGIHINQTCTFVDVFLATKLLLWEYVGHAGECGGAHLLRFC